MENEIGKHIAEINNQLAGTNASLVAVSKFHPIEAVMQAYEAGQRIFGESRVQELLEKAPFAPSDLKWHFIGHLQTNKVKALLPHVSLIESIDSVRLLELVDKEAAKASLTVRVLMQVHVAAEETKTGFLPDELLDYFRTHQFENLKATHICGIMGMASNTDDTDRVRQDFRNIRAIYDQIQKMCPDLRGFDTVSMGMSGDWKIAVEEGSTLIRVGTAIFGPRQY
ncbi:MAG: YggS family pyridoxal phosphate-dependent enzyme [Muribaculaceae bacterium]|nr:YggS family pyridoxal phosphate-dependent enzyme [Muribaculaceae bacterium]